MFFLFLFFFLRSRHTDFHVPRCCKNNDLPWGRGAVIDPNSPPSVHDPVNTRRTDLTVTGTAYKQNAYTRNHTDSWLLLHPPPPPPPSLSINTWDKSNVKTHTPSIAYRHLPPNSARFGYAIEGALFISAQLSTVAVSALRKVWV